MLGGYVGRKHVMLGAAAARAWQPCFADAGSAAWFDTSTSQLTTLDGAGAAWLPVPARSVPPGSPRAT